MWKSKLVAFLLSPLWLLNFVEESKASDMFLLKNYPVPIGSVLLGRSGRFDAFADKQQERGYHFPTRKGFPDGGDYKTPTISVQRQADAFSEFASYTIPLGSSSSNNSSQLPSLEKGFLMEPNNSPRRRRPFGNSAAWRSQQSEPLFQPSNTQTDENFPKATYLLPENQNPDVRHLNAERSDDYNLLAQNQAIIDKNVTIADVLPSLFTLLLNNTANLSSKHLRELFQQIPPSESRSAKRNNENGSDEWPLAPPAHSEAYGFGSHGYGTTASILRMVFTTTTQLPLWLSGATPEMAGYWKQGHDLNGQQQEGQGSQRKIPSSGNPNHQLPRPINEVIVPSRPSDPFPHGQAKLDENYIFSIPSLRQVANPTMSSNQHSQQQAPSLRASAFRNSDQNRIAQISCDGQLYSVLENMAANLACCEKFLYNSKEAVCESGRAVKRRKPLIVFGESGRTPQQFSNVRPNAPNGMMRSYPVNSNKHGLLRRCGKTTTLYNPFEQFCCAGSLYPKIPGQICCEHRSYAFSPDQTAACCSTIPYNFETHVCRPGNIVVLRTAGTKV